MIIDLCEAKKLLATDPIFLDTETTGFRDVDEVVEISIIDLAGAAIFSSLVKPSMPIPPRVTDIHGITNEMVAEAPTWSEIYPQLKEVFAGKSIGMYNAKFDLRLMQQSTQKAGLTWETGYANIFCVMEMYAEFKGVRNAGRPGYKWQKLAQAGKDLNISIPNTHRALDDTLLTKEVFVHLANRPE